jgi:hypothetical protein
MPYRLDLFTVRFEDEDSIVGPPHTYISVAQPIRPAGIETPACISNQCQGVVELEGQIEMLKAELDEILEKGRKEYARHARWCQRSDKSGQGSN